jgi:hypothetical protein
VSNIANIAAKIPLRRFDLAKFARYTTFGLARRFAATQQRAQDYVFTPRRNTPPAAHPC